ncbi:MAG: ABC transporter ATP-binding protein [Clostridia bacterium]|nr:ABC transporter ATP-binding protein [Clostridia bacterium]
MQAFQEEEYTKRLDMGLWKRLVLLAKPYWIHLVGIGLLMAVSAVLDVYLPMMNARAIDEFIARKTTDGLTAFAIEYIVLVLLQVATIFAFLLLCGVVETGVCYRIRKLGFQKLQELSFSYYDRMPVGSLMSRLTNDTQRMGDTIAWSILDLLYGAFYLVSCGIQMLRLNTMLGVVVLLVLPPLALLSFYFQREILSSYRQVRRRNSQLTGAFNEGIHGAGTTKTLVREEMNREEFHEIADGMRVSSVRAASLSALFLPLVVSLGSLATAVVLWKGGEQVLALEAGLGGMTVGVLQVFINYSVNFFGPVRDIARVFAEMQSAQAAAERVLTLLETEPEIRDREDVIEKYGDVFHPRCENWEPIRGDVEFSHVSFQYTEGEKVLDDFCLSVHAGQTIALVGETGSGKSTIVNLLCRFYEPTQGEIRIDQVDYRERSQMWLQSSLGYVLQSPHLFSGTIADNIRYGYPEASLEEVTRAARTVGADLFIEALPKGYETEVGEGGSGLSTGQKQLISFARAILKNPRIFVLDEATSSVDTETEMMIQKAIQTTLSGRTSFIIAHRLSTIRSADQILVIEGGKIAESGTHRELIARKGMYYTLYTNQFQDEQGLSLLENA